ncbi:DNA-protecting protein DprA [bacterium DOLZORAL124_38_8]|nr:MAG: DNA-protecting protein DprA [bacterium DOLZORAL124_38_8]
MKQKQYLVAIHKALGLTFLRYKKLSPVFANNWQNLWKASLNELLEVGLSKKEIERFVSERTKINPVEEYEYLQQRGISVLFYEDELFPPQLKNIYNPPVLLFMRGSLLPTDFPSVSVVGARKISDYGKRALEHIVKEVAQAGVTIVSGLALGTDVLAHQVAVQNGARTIAVLGNAIDSIYPKANERFANQLIEENQGVILSEYLPGTKISPGNFPQRNRIVSGLSRATIIVEAAEKSGSLITGKLAIDQNKELFVVPGSIFSQNSAGTNQLLLSGEAFPVLSGKQVLEHLQLGNNTIETKKVQQTFECTAVESSILKLLSEHEQLHIDEIIQSVPHKNTEVVSALAILEIKGGVKNSGKQVYHSTV